MKQTVHACLALVLFASPVAASAASAIAMHRDPGCGCCEKWAAQIRRELGRPVRTLDDPNRSAFQAKLGVPADLASCHTAVIDGVVVEGHVPAADIKRVLAEKPRGIRGLAVGGMPLGSPGMEMPGMRAQRYDVIAFGAGGRRAYARHG
ncbi:DUF411 domain-containing protein [Sphingomonas sp. TX0543]|jgi:hypothetical protein|uniref:CopG protein n=2 Tax=root TaxID=1 RepID=A0A160TQ22_9ZZZZ|nr:DUF411 domain-containing protein [Sphingomonas sp. 66-10]OJU20366.1 MAG: metal-binding protein [Sphingomonas sp. 66-10]